MDIKYILMKRNLAISIICVCVCVFGLSCNRAEPSNEQMIMTVTPCYDNEHEIDCALKKIILTGSDLPLDTLACSELGSDQLRLLPFYIIAADSIGGMKQTIETMKNQ